MSCDLAVFDELNEFCDFFRVDICDFSLIKILFELISCKVDNSAGFRDWISNPLIERFVLFILLRGYSTDILELVLTERCQEFFCYLLTIRIVTINQK